MKKIEWLDNFAESFAKSVKMEKKASKNLERQSIIVDKSVVKEAKLGDVIEYDNKFYKVADLDYVDEKGEGAVLDEVDSANPYEGIENDPMSVSMGTNAAPFEGQIKSQEYSRTNPGDVYNVEVPENYEQAAEETAKQIEKERATDRTTVPGYFKNPVDESTTPATTVEVTNDVADTDAEVNTEDIPADVTKDVTEDIAENVVKDDLTDVSVEVPENDESAETITDEEIEDAESTASKRCNRILRRIMASKSK